MKKYYIGGAILVLVLLAACCVRTYTSSPGHVTAEMYQQFEATKPTCYGWSYLMNAEATYADAPGKSLCIGWLK